MYQNLHESLKLDINDLSSFRLSQEIYEKSGRVVSQVAPRKKHFPEYINTLQKNNLDQYNSTISQYQQEMSSKKIINNQLQENSKQFNLRESQVRNKQLGVPKRSDAQSSLKKQEIVYKFLQQLSEPIPIGRGFRENHMKKIELSAQKLRLQKEIAINKNSYQNQNYNNSQIQQDNVLKQTIDNPMNIDFQNFSVFNSQQTDKYQEQIYQSQNMNQSESGQYNQNTNFIKAFSPNQTQRFPQIQHLQQKNQSSISFARFSNNLTKSQISSKQIIYKKIEESTNQNTVQTLKTSKKFFLDKKKLSGIQNLMNFKNDQFKTPRDQQLGVLQKAMWRQIQQRAGTTNSGFRAIPKISQLILTQQPSSINQNTQSKYLQIKSNQTKQVGPKNEILVTDDNFDDQPNILSPFQIQKQKKIQYGNDEISSDSFQDGASFKKGQKNSNKKANVSFDKKEGLMSKISSQNDESSSSEDVNQSFQISQGFEIQEKENEKYLNKDEENFSQKLDIRKYLITYGFSKMQKFLKKMSQDRVKQDIIGKSILQAAKESKIDLSQEAIEKMKDDIKLLANKKIMQKREKETKIAQRASMSGSPVQMADIQNNQFCCSIAQKSQNFIEQTKRKTFNPFESIISMPEQSSPGNQSFGKNQTKLDKTQREKCKHGQTQDEILLECIELFKKFLKFKSYLQRSLQVEVKRDILIQGMLNRLEQDQDNIEQKYIGDILMDDSKLIKILQDPIIDIIETNEEHTHELEIANQGNLGSPAKQRKANQVILYQDQNRQSKIYLTKFQKTLSKQTLKVLDDVQYSYYNAEQVNTPNQNDKDFSIKKKFEIMKLKGSNQVQNQKNKINKYSNVIDYITENNNQDKQLLEKLTDSQSTKKANELMKKIQVKELKNVQFLFKLQLINKMIQKEMEQNLKQSRSPYVQIDLENMKDEDKSNRKYNISGYDEMFQQKAERFIDISDTWWKQQKAFMKLVRQVNFANKKKIDLEIDQISEEQQSRATPQQDSPKNQQSVLGEIDAKQKFYAKAKHEVIGNNQPQTCESVFYNACKKQLLLPFPLFKCLNDNNLKFHGKNLGMGYVSALAQMIEENIDPQMHILSLHLDDCNMKDEEFALILQAISNSQHFYQSVQCIKYSNNQMGLKSCMELKSILDKDHGNPHFSVEAYCLKELILTNVSFKQIRDLRIFADLLGSPSTENLRVLKIKQVNLNDSEIVENISNFIQQSINLTSLTLSQCNLGARALLKNGEDEKTVLNVSLIKIFDALIKNKSLLLQKIDLSGNPISFQIKNYKESINQILMHIVNILESKLELIHLNLAGMKLTSSLSQHLIPVLKQNYSLSYFNISNNNLSIFDYQHIIQELQIVDPSNQVNQKAIDILLSNDQCFKSQIDNFKSNHLKDGYFNRYQNQETKSPAQTSFKINEYIDQYKPQIQSECAFDSDIHSSMINSAILKRVSETKQLEKKINIEENITGQFRGEQAQHTLMSCLADSLILKRNPRYCEMVFNKIFLVGWNNIEAPFDNFDFFNPIQWNLDYHGQLNDNHEVIQAQADSIGSQYLSICIDKDKISEYFQEITNSSACQLLKVYYGLKFIKQNQKSSQYSHLYTFGTFTDWKAHQMAKIFQVTLFLSGNSYNESENNILINDVFDYVNNDLNKHFKFIKQQVWQVWQTHLKNESALNIGFTHDQFGNFSKEKQEHLIKEQLYCFCQLIEKPGKHSIFIYDSAQDRFYWRSVIIEIENFEYGNTNALKKPRQQILPPEKQDQMKQKIRNDFKNMQNKMMSKALLHDISPGNLNIAEYFQIKQDIQYILKAIENNYEAFTEIFNQLLSESQKSYPFLQFEDLIKFARKANLIPNSKLDELENQINDSDQSQKKEQKLNDANTIFQFKNINRSEFIRAIIWIFQQKYNHNYQPQKFERYLQKYIITHAQNRVYWGIKQEFQECEQIQNIITEQKQQLINFLAVSAHTKGCYTGFNQLVASEVVIDGQLNSLKPEPIKPKAAKKKKGKKAPEKKEDPKNPEIIKPPPPPPETIPISLYDLNKLFILSLRFQISEPMIQDKIDGQFNSIDELCEFFYRIAKHVYDQSNYSQEINKIPKEISQMFECSIEEKFLKVLNQALKTTQIQNQK